MWFDVAVALAEIEGGPKPAPVPPPHRDSHDSQNSQNSQAPEALGAKPAPAPTVEFAGFAEFATPPAPKPDPAPPDTFRHGRSVTGHPLTWTGRPVTLAEWRGLSEWQRDGPNGRHWCGCCRAWVEAATALAHADALRAEWLERRGG